MYLIGIDVGGTSIKIGLFKEDKLINKYSIKTDVDNVINQLFLEIEKIINSNKIDIKDLSKIGVGFPGLISDGKVLYSVNLNVSNCNLQKKLEEKFKCTVVLKNDVDMALLAELNLGSHKKTDNIIMLTFGTGIGGSIALNGKLWEGKASGEFGHIIFERNGIKCNCGRSGCAEKYLSAVSFVSYAKKVCKNTNSMLKNFDDLKCSDIEMCCLNNDKVAVDLVEEYAQNLSEYLLDICNLLRPDTILIGGGLSFAPLILEKSAKLCIKKGFGYPFAPKTQITLAKLGGDSGIYGVLFAT